MEKRGVQQFKISLSVYHPPTKCSRFSLPTYNISQKTWNIINGPWFGWRYNEQKITQISPKRTVTVGIYQECVYVQNDLKRTVLQMYYSIPDTVLSLNKHAFYARIYCTAWIHNRHIFERQINILNIRFPGRSYMINCQVNSLSAMNQLSIRSVRNFPLNFISFVSWSA